MAMDPNPIPPAPPFSSAFSGGPLPFLTHTIAEAENHIIPAANATPPAPQPPQHPPYADMICTAIAALKEKDGSSKRAIARYIEQAYTGLPPTHDSLLTHNLKRLKNSGHLVMVKKSYKLFRSDDVPAPTGTASPTANTAANANDLSQLQPQPTPPSRGRGRPPKNKTQPALFPQISQPQQPQQGFIQIEQSQQVQPQPHPHPQQVQQQFPVANSLQQYPDPVLVALGLVDDPSIVQKRGRGRPRKIVGPVDVTGQVASASAGRRRGRPPGSRAGIAKPWAPKRAGRPPKPKSVSSISNGLKRRPGRPRKEHPSVVPFAPAPAPVIAPPNASTEAAATGQAPNVPEVGTGATNVPPMPAPGVPVVPTVNSPRPRGRPRKYPVAVSQVPVAGEIVAVSSGRGRPRGSRGRGRGGLAGRGGYQNVGGYLKPKSSTGRPVGRPRKVKPVM